MIIVLDEYGNTDNRQYKLKGYDEDVIHND